MHNNIKKLRDYINATVFVITLAIIAAGLKSQLSLSLVGVALQLAVLPAMIAKFRNFFSKTTVVLSILLLGLLVNVALVHFILNTKNPDIGMVLMTLVVYTTVITPDVAATSLLIDEETRSWEILAFYFWFLISFGLATLFLMSARSEMSVTSFTAPPLLRLLALAVTYLELVAIPSALVLIYRRVRTFLIFLPLPIMLGYALLFTSKVAGMFV